MPLWLVFLVPALDLTYLSSSLVREVARFGGDVSSLVHPVVAEEAPPVGVEVRASEPTKRKKKPVKDERQSSLF